ncbi:hypothetical protein F5Y09DRAFT_155441 [Xylaria sp. FL1042]|nr:hypothetical protein F5Y09DRAFT_155441 [Xylaria sp. FL1042]
MPGYTKLRPLAVARRASEYPSPSLRRPPPSWKIYPSDESGTILSYLSVDMARYKHVHYSLFCTGTIPDSSSASKQLSEVLYL